MLRNTIKSMLPKAVLRGVDRGRFWLEYYLRGCRDCVDATFGLREELMPPKRYIYVIGGDFVASGKIHFSRLQTRAGLTPQSHVLDVGCGVGRLAVRHVGYLSPRGRYEGFDTWTAGVKWCQHQITPRYSNFHFQVADLYNGFYAPKGKYRAEEYRFPFDDASFDVVFMGSVMTHLLPDEFRNYLKETARVLKEGGHCLITYFSLSPEAIERMNRGEAALQFQHDHGVYRTATEEIHENAVAYDEAFLRRTYAENGLTIKEPVEYGSWSGVPNNESFQDIIVAAREGHARP